MSGPDAVRRYLRPYLALQSKDVYANGVALAGKVLDSIDAGGRNPAALFAGVTGSALFSAHLTLARLADTGAVDNELTRYIASRSWPTPPLSDSVFTSRVLTRSLLSRGHLREAYEVIGANPGTNRVHFAETALLNGLPAHSAATEFQRWLSDTFPIPIAWTLPWWAARRDTISLRRAGRRAEVLAVAKNPAERPVLQYIAESARAYLALAKGDTALSLRRFQALPQNVCPACYFDRLTLAQLLAERKSDQEAWRILKAEHPATTLSPAPSEILWVLLRGRVAERIGKSETAARAYAWVAGMWRNADPELQPYVTEAREGLARLTGERK
jgi:hypothetical protein